MERPSGTIVATKRPAFVAYQPTRLKSSIDRSSSVSSVAWSVLGLAGDRAVERLAITEHAVPTEMRRRVDHMLDLLRRADAAAAPAATDFDADYAETEGAGFVPRHHIDCLRAEFLAELQRLNANGAESRDDAVSQADVVRVLTAMERVAGELAFGRRSDFVDRLSSPGALEAVIEVAHDMRSPLASILFLVDTIQRGQSGPTNAVQNRQLGLIYGAALGLSNMACDVIDAVRGHRLIDGQPEPFSVEETIDAVCAVVHPVGEEKQLPIHVVLPVVDGRVGYATALTRVLLNLTSNALRYTEKGSVTIGCTETQSDVVEFWIKDTGSGIPDDVLAMLFNGFRPASNGLRFSSAGLGLAICRSLLEAMGSELRVESGPDHGTRFSFELTLPPA